MARASLRSRPAEQDAIYSERDLIHPVHGRHGMVATEEATATRIGLEVLQRGGNAVDAAVTVGFALAVTLPRAGNLGGGGFMLVHDAASGDTVAIDYREKAGGNAFRDMFLDARGEAGPREVALQRPRRGRARDRRRPRAGARALWHDQPGRGARACDRLAEQGIVVSEGLAASLDGAGDRLRKWPSSVKIFSKAGGAPYQPGETLVQRDLAASLRLIAEQGPSALYGGPIGQKIVASVARAGGNLTIADLRSYEAVVREPVRGDYRGYEIVSMPPPSSGGVHIVQILNTLEGFPIGSLGQNGAKTIHLMAEAMKLAYADRSEYLGDPDFVAVPGRGAHLEGLRRASARPDRSPPCAARGRDQARRPHAVRSPDTTHFSIVDAAGNAVANTYTLNFSYGTGLVAEGTGILLNNELDDFSAKPGVPNAYGLIGGDANAVGAEQTAALVHVADHRAAGRQDHSW